MIICPYCGAENLPDSLMCAKCLHMLIKVGDTTDQAGDRGKDRRTPTFPPLPKSVYETMDIESLALYIDGGIAFNIIKVPSTIILGRNTAVDPVLYFDLTPFNAADKGVSRKHAEIARIGDKWRIADLTSTNGTWLNGKRLMAYTLYILSSGDVLTLGNLDIILYFRQSSE